MARCIEQAKCIHEFPVAAAIIDKNGTLLTIKTNQVEHDSHPLHHAECLAMQEAARIVGYRNLHKLFLVSTLEPCDMCTAACALYRVKSVFFGAYNMQKKYPSPSRWVGGIMEEQNQALLTGIFNRTR